VTGDGRSTLRASFPVHTYEVDAFGTLEVPAVSGYLQEVAGLHAAQLGVGLDVLRARGLTWVLGRQRIELPVAVQVGETLEIETWPAGVDRLVALRDFRLRRSDGVEVGRATTQWLVLDVATRRPVRPDEVLDARFARPLLESVAPLARKLPAPERWDRERRFHVRYSDIDGNLHVTNASYVAWAIEAAPVELWRSSRLAAVEVHYVAEVLHGESILSRTSQTAPGAFAHAIVREADGRELARLASAWAPRSS
jgi:acyl-ACP thioesterase